MTNISQTQSGKAFEYAIAMAMEKRIGMALLCSDASFLTAQGAYNIHPPESQRTFDHAAAEVAAFIIRRDQQLNNATKIIIQPDSAGKKGDVRDVIIRIHDEEIGFSAKNNHDAVKHSRLSDKIDFGDEWGGYPVSTKYFNSVRRVFDQLSQLKQNKKLFRDIPNKEGTVYLPILTAFKDEFSELCTVHGGGFISNVFSYLLGATDFYKIIKQDKHDIVTIQSINMNGSLRWGQKLKTPTRILSIKRKSRSNNTLLVTFDEGWQLSFRIHSEISCFDILGGNPMKVMSNFRDGSTLLDAL